MKLLGEPCYLVGGNLGVRIRRNGVDLFMWKEKQIEVTSERLQEIGQFRRELDSVLRAGD
ncbi:MAG: hypothetical protein WAM91_15245 [Candidatus Acidiferrales bacterium]